MRNRRAFLHYLAANFGSEADLQFMLIDHYFFEEKFDLALASLGALERAVGGEDERPDEESCRFHWAPFKEFK